MTPLRFPGPLPPLALVLALALASSGCGGARPHVTLDHCRYPVSMTSWVLDPDGFPISIASMDRVGSLEACDRGWSIAWTIVPFNQVDFSEEVNRQVEAAGGEAVLNFRVTADTPVLLDILPGMFFVHWVPVWPGSVAVEATGDIVRRRGLPAPTPASAAGVTR